MRRPPLPSFPLSSAGIRRGCLAGVFPLPAPHVPALHVHTAATSTGLERCPDLGCAQVPARPERSRAGALGFGLAVPPLRPAPRPRRAAADRPLRDDASSQRGSRSQRAGSGRGLSAEPRRRIPAGVRAELIFPPKPDLAGGAGPSAAAGRAGRGAPGPPPVGCGCLPGPASREGGSPAWERGGGGDRGGGHGDPRQPGVLRAGE